MDFAPGQRWLSIAEPELGLGTVLRTDGRFVEVGFTATGIVRRYAARSAPLSRAAFRPGERVRGAGRSFVVERVEQHGGTLCYRGDGQVLREEELDAIQNVAGAERRLLAGRIDPIDHFELRREALERRAAARRSPAWGVLSARVELLEHQLRVAEVASARRQPRVLLADEVGLGKTIEAGLILARLLATGRAERILVLVPEALVCQWYLELQRRFHLAFAIYDEERCEAIETADPARNPFGDEQRVIAAVSWLRDQPRRAAQAEQAGWDLLVVDEAHHLAWSPQQPSPEYTLVANLAAAIPGLILLTATPEQLGRSGHFARLRLLDPARYSNLDAYLEEAERYVQLSAIVDKLHHGMALDSAERSALTTALKEDPALRHAAARLHAPDPVTTAAVLEALIDRHGTGRVMFRNRRAAIGGFPQRVPRLVELDGTALDETARQRLLAEFVADTDQPPAALDYDYTADPRLPWLLGLLAEHPRDKFLLVCRHRTKLQALEEALRRHSGIALARFHEDMSLTQRDRNAAYFAAADGARLLLATEIGAEGRNFQFAHHLVLWDLPLDPDLLEQRIGRLDRIGQRHPIQLHAVAFTGTAQHALLRWYRDGLDAFRASPADGRALYQRFAARLRAIGIEHAHGAEDSDAELEALIAETRVAHAELSAQLERGRDRLLELAQQRLGGASTLRDALIAADTDLAADTFVLRVFELFGVQHEQLGPRSYLLDPEYLNTDGLPGWRDGPQRITFDRATALAHEDQPLLRLDHPLVAGALDLLLGSERGNCAFLIDDALPPRSARLEAWFVLDVVTEATLHADRFLPPLPLRSVTDTRLHDCSAWQPSAIALGRAAERPVDIERQRGRLAALLPAMLRRCEQIAQARAAEEIQRALEIMERTLGAEHERLAALRRINTAVSARELDAIEAERRALRHCLPRAQPRLDSLRFVCSADFVAERPVTAT